MPSGSILRLAIIHICDAAVRVNSQVVDLGQDAAMLAAALGLDPKVRDLVEQWQRLQSARILCSVDGVEISVFDARSRRRPDDLAWRSGVRLSAKFLSGLREHAVPLDRRIVGQLSSSPTALDAYAWISLSLPHSVAGKILHAAWGDLIRRFGTASQDLAGFRSAFELALRLVYEADASLDLALDDDGVSVRRTELADGKLAIQASSAALEDAEAIKLVGAKEYTHPTERPRPAPPAPPAADLDVADATVRPRVSVPAGPGGERLSDTTAADRITQNNISLLRHLTGLTLIIWLRRGTGEESALVGVTPNPRFEADRLTVLAVEPMILQISGGLNERDFERVSAWVMSNRDVIDEFWEGGITSFAEMNRRVRKVPTQGLR